MSKKKPNAKPTPIFLRPTAEERKAIVDAANAGNRPINREVRRVIREHYGLKPELTASAR